MRKALHPVRNELIDVAVYIKEFGNGPLAPEEKVLCPCCQARLNIVAASAATKGHFAHPKNSDYCRLKESHEKPYLLLPPRNRDPHKGRLLKRAFRDDWGKYFGMMKSRIDGFSYDEFFKILETAEQRGIWEYVGIESCHLSYIFLTLLDFPQSSGYKVKGKLARRWWIRCWFESCVKGYDDLWIHPASSVKFFRGWYNLPEGKKKPGLADLDRCQGEDMGDFPMTGVELNSHIVDQCEKWLDKNFRF